MQIMTYRTYGKASLALILALILLLTGCGMALGPSQTASVTTSEPTEAVSASTPAPASSGPQLSRQEKCGFR